MKSINYCVPLLFLCVLISNNVHETQSAIIPAIINSVKIISASMEAFKKYNNTEKTISQDDILKLQTKITEAVENVNTHILHSIEKLSLTVESTPVFEGMRKDLEFLRSAFVDNIDVISNVNFNGIIKQSIVDEMTNYFSEFRGKLKSFVTNYIEPNGVVVATGEVKLFYDFILNRDTLAATVSDDCYLESTHTKLFKSYVYIFTTLTDAYAMALYVHALQYRKELKINQGKNADEIRESAFKLLHQYNGDMEEFIKKTKWALDKASREIRNCGTIELKRGELYEHISFSHLFPKLRESVSVDTFPLCTPYRINNNEYVNISNFEFGECKDHDLKVYGSTLRLYLNRTNSEWPFKYLINDLIFRSDDIMGHVKKVPEISEGRFICYPEFCTVFRKNAFAISTQNIRAKPGNAITGLRFRLKNKVIYIDIQEGKYLDYMQVDNKTLTWTEMPENENDVVYLSREVRKFELGPVELEQNEYLISIQLQLKADGIIGFYVGGMNAIDGLDKVPSRSSNSVDSNELDLSGSDNPEEFGDNVKNLISKAPVPSKPYHLSFQPTDFMKDFGITTIPLIDIREVVSKPPAPLAGCGMYHQAAKGSGGFLSLDLISTNLNHFVEYDEVKQLIDISSF